MPIAVNGSSWVCYGDKFDGQFTLATESKESFGLVAPHASDNQHVHDQLFHWSNPALTGNGTVDVDEARKGYFSGFETPKKYPMYVPLPAPPPPRPVIFLRIVRSRSRIQLPLRLS
jgi:hypothetical protein